MSDEQHLAMPQLYGGPAYSRPPRPVQEIVRPFDPDELPIEAERIDGEIATGSELAGATWAPVSSPPAKPKGLRRNRAGKAAKGGQTATAPVAPSPVAASSQANGIGELQARPFSLRNLGKIFGGDHK